MTTRGLRNNNPGNLRRGSGPWLGEASAQTDPDFVVFEAPVFGLRALARTLINYQRIHGLRTLREILTRWAPPLENDTAAYVADAAARCGVGADAPISLDDPSRLAPLVEAIVRHENGVQPYSAAEISEALALAGLAPSPTA